MRAWVSGPRLPLGMRLGIVSAPIRPELSRSFGRGLASLCIDVVIGIAVLAVVVGGLAMYELLARVIPSQVMG